MSAEESLAFVDTNVLVYAYEKVQSARSRVAQELVLRLGAARRLSLSMQVLQEFFVTITRKVRVACTPGEALAHLDDLSVWPLVVLDYSGLREAAQLSRDASLSFWDALIVVAAARSGAAVLYTEDLNDGQEILGVKVINPFRELEAAP